MPYFPKLNQTPNGLRYPLVGGMGQRHFAGTNSKPRKLLENAHAAQRQSHQSGAPRNDGERSFSTRERPAGLTENGQKVWILIKKTHI
jgi:hypothetical protein